MVYKVMAISGALEKGAPCSGIVRACLAINNPSLEFEVADISTFPLFNVDTIVQNGYPEEVQYLREAISRCHALLICTPEHNLKTSAALKNAYDWISFSENPEMPSPIKYLVCGVIGCSPTGGAKASEHLKRMFEYCKVKPMGETLQITENS
jgi:NAD(P)H-dependent FMN reductase